jgi:3-hydroxybutyryl-CoA dehydrogenase
MEINSVGILGAGTMGRQLALLFAAHNIPVSLWNHRCQSNFQAEFGRLDFTNTE